MTTEPKFIPESAVPLALEGGVECRVRLIDCVGYMVAGGHGPRGKRQAPHGEKPVVR